MEALQKIGRIILEAIKKLDPVLFSCSTLLSVISILTIWGAVDNFGRSKLRMQIFIFILGVIVTVLIAYVDFRVIVDKLWLPMLLVSIALLALTLIVGSSGENMETANRSWLNIPGINIMIQPSEFVKIAMVCSYAKHMMEGKEEYRDVLGV